MALALCFFAGLFVGFLADVAPLAAAPARGNLSGAQIVTLSTDAQAGRVAEFLRNEISLRTGVLLGSGASLPGTETPAVVLGLPDALPAGVSLPAEPAVPKRPEGFAILVDGTSRQAPTVFLLGRDAKGLLFAAGRLLRELYLAQGFVDVRENLTVATAPTHPLRGQQIIRSTQSEDRFVDWNDTEQRQQHIRDLALFGTNTIEPKHSGDIAAFCEELDLDLAYTVNCDDIIDLNARTDAEIRAHFADVPGIDQFVTYGGDHSGSRRPQETFPAMERVVPLVLESHPGATWWYSNQCLKDHAVDEDDFIFTYLRVKQPDWLYGMIYGPWTKRGLREIRSDLPAQYRIRHYPEICHVRWCMYPVPKWDRAWAQVWNRNVSTYAMPRMMRAIHDATHAQTIGATPYNHTGAYNDLNKFVFSAMGWDPDQDLEGFVKEYARVFFAYQLESSAPSREKLDQLTAKIANATFLLEDNWTQAIDRSTSPRQALKEWKEIATLLGGPEQVRKNWRLELFLTKAFIDAQVKRKYDAEMRLEREAYEALRRAPATGVQTAIAQARAALQRIETEFPAKAELLAELKALGTRGGYGDLDSTLDNLYSPLGDRGWLETRLGRARTLADVQDLLDYEDPGPGGFYDNLGVAGEQPHLVRQLDWQQDPGFVHSPIEWQDHRPGTQRRQSQHSHATSRYKTPLILRWEGLDPKVTYHIEVVYLGPFKPMFRCDTDDGLEIHGPRGNSDETPVRYDIPHATTKDGVLQLEWRLTNETRGVSVTEIWLRPNRIKDS